MTEPMVAAILLTRDRPQMAARAVRSFRAQTYGNKWLVVLDQSDDLAGQLPGQREIWCDGRPFPGSSIGKLRNAAITLAKSVEIIVHWDSDDWSHPNRIFEQVALLQSSGADAVGYRQMLFWREPNLSGPDLEYFRPAEAWLYSHRRPGHALGTSLCYWRRTWERKPFPDEPRGPQASGEDHLWRQGLNVVSDSALAALVWYRDYFELSQPEPRMIASIHDGNSSQAYDLEAIIARGGTEWARAPGWDDFCRERMKL